MEVGLIKKLIELAYEKGVRAGENGVVTTAAEAAQEVLDSDDGADTLEMIPAAESYVGLLRESLGHITDKPWDDDSLLHARISEAIGEPVQYADMVAMKREDDKSVL